MEVSNIFHNKFYKLLFCNNWNSSSYFWKSKGGKKKVGLWILAWSRKGRYMISHMQIAGDAKCCLQHKCYAAIHNSVNNCQSSQTWLQKWRWIQEEISQKVISKLCYHGFAHCSWVKTLGFTLPLGSHPDQCPKGSSWTTFPPVGSSHKHTSLHPLKHCCR